MRTDVEPLLLKAVQTWKITFEDQTAAARRQHIVQGPSYPAVRVQPLRVRDGAADDQTSAQPDHRLQLLGYRFQHGRKGLVDPVAPDLATEVEHFGGRRGGVFGEGDQE